MVGGKKYKGYIIKVGYKFLGQSTRNWVLRDFEGATIFHDDLKFVLRETKWVDKRYKGKVSIIEVEVTEIGEVTRESAK